MCSVVWIAVMLNQRFLRSFTICHRRARVLCSQLSDISLFSRGGRIPCLVSLYCGFIRDLPASVRSLFENNTGPCYASQTMNNRPEISEEVLIWSVLCSSKIVYWFAENILLDFGVKVHKKFCELWTKPKIMEIFGWRLVFLCVIYFLVIQIAPKIMSYLQ